MKRTALLIVVSLLAFLLLQCQYAKDVVEDLNKAAKQAEEKNKSSSSGSEEISSSGNGEVSSSSSRLETNKKRKEAK